jgi:hypothetical protein
MVGHRRGKAQEDFGVGNEGLYQGVVADHIDGQLREPLQQHGLVAGPHRFLDFCEDEEIWHGALV